MRSLTDFFLHELGAPSMKKPHFLDPKTLWRGKQICIPTPPGAPQLGPAASRDLTPPRPFTHHSAFVTLLWDRGHLESWDYVFRLSNTSLAFFFF